MNEKQSPRDTQNLLSLCGYLQDRCESDRVSIANQLHDEIGGLLVAARLNVAWIEERISSQDPVLGEHFKRLHEALRRGVEVKRRIVEDLRPTLLDNIGLYSALRWQMGRACEAAQLSYSELYPDEELAMQPDAAITVFRIVEEAIRNIVRHAAARHAELAVEERGDVLNVLIRDDGIGISAEQLDADGSLGIATMTYRVARLGGRMRWADAPGHGTELQVDLPLANLVRTEALRN